MTPERSFGGGPRRARGERVASGERDAPGTADLVVSPSRLAPRPPPATTVERPDLVRALRRRRDARVVRVCAPRGWGKTTLLAQWRAAELDTDREVCWLTIDENDHTVERFLAAFVAACEAGVADFRLGWRDVAPAVGVDPVAAVIPIVADELAVTSSRALVVLDDLHRAPPACFEAVRYLLRLLPANVQLAYTTIGQLPLHIAQMRVGGEVLDIGPEQLGLDGADAQRMARAAGVELDDAAADTLIQRTEGWPAGVAVAVRLLGTATSSPDEVVGELSGLDRSIARLLDEQVIRWLGDADLKMLTSSSILDEVDGPLVDAVTGSTDGAERLERLAAPGGFVVRSEDAPAAYRYHGLLRDVLHDALEMSTPPEQVRELHRRAAVELARTGRVAESIVHSGRAGQFEVGADALAADLPQLVGDPDLTDLRSGVESLTEHGDPSYVPLALSATMLCGLSGSTDRATALLHAVASATWAGPLPGGWGSVDEAVAILGGAFADGVVRREAVVAAAPTARGGSPWASLAQFAAGRRSFLAGDHDVARAWFERTTTLVGIPSASPTPFERLVAAMSAGYLAIILSEGGRVGEADAALDSAGELLGRPEWRDRPVAAPMYLARGVLEIAAQRPHDAEVALDRARTLAPQAGSTVFHALVELTRAAEFRGDLDSARQHLAEAELVAPSLIECDLLQRRCSALGRLLHPATLSQAGLVSPITDGEMAVLRRVPSDLTQVEIAKALYLSINTVKSHLRSIYQKLGVSSRPAAAQRARELGLLLDESAPTGPDELR